MVPPNARPKEAAAPDTVLSDPLCETVELTYPMPRSERKKKPRWCSGSRARVAAAGALLLTGALLMGGGADSTVLLRGGSGTGGRGGYAGGGGSTHSRWMQIRSPLQSTSRLQPSSARAAPAVRIQTASTDDAILDM